MGDLEFIQNCVKADKRSWDEFIEKYSRLIYGYIHSTIDSRGHTFAQDNIDDIFHDIILSLVKDNFRKLNSFKAKNGCSFASWLRQVTVNFTIDYMRKLRPSVSLDEEDDAGLCLKDIFFSKNLPVAEAAVFEEKSAHLKDCIGKLDTEEKYFIELHIYRNLALDELMGALKLARGAVDMRKSRIIAKLRECFKSRGFLLDF